MNDAVKFVAERTGLSEDKAQAAVQAVADFAKQRFPAFAGQIDHFLGAKSDEGGGGSGGGLLDKLGGMFGS